MELFLFKTPEDLYIAEMETCKGDLPTFGAVDPLYDGNYYKELNVGVTLKHDPKRYTCGMEGWLDWFINQALPNGWALISEEFPFDPKTLKIVKFIEHE